jgi:hypothetical protein
MRIFIFLSILVGVILSAGCQPNPIQPEATPLPTSSPAASATPVITPDRMEEEATKIPELVPTSEETTPVTGEVPNELLQTIQKDLAERIGADLANITVIQAQAVVWNDGAMGCPQPGVMYTQSMVSGYRVMLEVEAQKYDYHAAETGYFILCENALQLNPPEGTPDY